MGEALACDVWLACDRRGRKWLILNGEHEMCWVHVPQRLTAAEVPPIAVYALRRMAVERIDALLRGPHFLDRRGEGHRRPDTVSGGDRTIADDARRVAAYEQQDDDEAPLGTDTRDREGR